MNNFLNSTGDDDKIHEGPDEVKLVNPLRWYGLLVPQSLKNAQTQFIKGARHENTGLTIVLEETVEVANIMAKLKESESVVDELRRKLNDDSTDQEDCTAAKIGD